MGADEVENIGIKRSKEKIDQAELILALFDSSRPLDPEDEDLVLDLKKSSAEKIAIITKCDENANDDLQNGGNYVSEIENKLMENGFDIILKISVVCNPDGVKEALAKTVEDLFVDEKISIGDDAVISNARQSASVVRALSCIETAMNAFEIGLPEDASSSDIELALGAISELDGRSVTEEIVNDIFSRFCVGK